MDCAFQLYIKSHWHTQGHLGFILCYLSRVYSCAFDIYVYDSFWVNFLKGLKPVCVFIFCRWMASRSHTIFWKDYHCIAFALLSKINWLYLHEFLSGLSIVLHWSICPFFCSIAQSWLLWDFPSKSTGVRCHCPPHYNFIISNNVSRNIPPTEFYERETKLGHLKTRINPKLLSVEMQN